MKVWEKLRNMSLWNGVMDFDYTVLELQDEYVRLLNLFIPVRKDYAETERLFREELVKGDFYANRLAVFDEVDAADYLSDAREGERVRIVVNSDRPRFIRAFMELLEEDLYSFNYLYCMLGKVEAGVSQCTSPCSDELVAYAVDFDLDSVRDNVLGLSSKESRLEYIKGELDRSRQHFTLDHQIRMEFETVLSDYCRTLGSEPSDNGPAPVGAVRDGSSGETNFLADFVKPVSYMNLFEYMQDYDVFAMGQSASVLQWAIDHGDFSSVNINDGKKSYYYEMLKVLGGNTKGGGWKDSVARSLGISDWNRVIDHLHNNGDKFKKFSKNLRIS